MNGEVIFHDDNRYIAGEPANISISIEGDPNHRYLIYDRYKGSEATFTDEIISEIAFLTTNENGKWSLSDISTPVPPDWAVGTWEIILQDYEALTEGKTIEKVLATFEVDSSDSVESEPPVFNNLGLEPSFRGDETTTPGVGDTCSGCGTVPSCPPGQKAVSVVDYPARVPVGGACYPCHYECKDIFTEPPSNGSIRGENPCPECDLGCDYIASEWVCKEESVNGDVMNGERGDFCSGFMPDLRANFDPPLTDDDIGLRKVGDASNFSYHFTGLKAGQTYVVRNVGADTGFNTQATFKADDRGEYHLRVTTPIPDSFPADRYSVVVSGPCLEEPVVVARFLIEGKDARNGAKGNNGSTGGDVPECTGGMILGPDGKCRLPEGDKKVLIAAAAIILLLMFGDM